VNLADLSNRLTQWLAGTGPLGEIVISSRIRLARNVAGFPFLSRCSEDQRRQIADTVQAAVDAAGVLEDPLTVDVEQASELDRQFLVERQLISRQHAAGPGARRVLANGSETVALMVNEEDHLRMQVLATGLQLESAWEKINHIDDAVEQRVPYSYSGRYGYLTACPTNVGTGIRVSVMLHLPALKMTGEIEKVFQAARDMRLAIRGLFGEGTEAGGDFFQVSNQTTLGRTENQIIQDFREQIIPDIIQYEKVAREALVERKTDVIDDKVFRSLGLLRFARLLTTSETLFHLSLIRLGVHLGRIRDVSLQTVNELFLFSQPGHLQKMVGKEMTPDERAKARAEMIRAKLN
jgi:protein arginine kinase